MKTIRISMCVACVALWAVAASADIVPVKHTMDYRNNDWLGGIWFVEPSAILDHSPYCRNSTEDWGWTHVVASRVPKGATGIESATVTIIAWKIDVEAGEDDVIYALPEAPASTSAAKTNGARLGQLCSPTESPITIAWPDVGQTLGYENLWSVTEFKLPSDVIANLWANGQVCFYMDIDQTNADGMRATLKNAVLQVNYIAPKPEVTTVSVYRFWSSTLSGHFYTANQDERDFVIATYPDSWTYEGAVFDAMEDGTDPMSVPVHRFWSGTLRGHFYTASEDEAAHVIAYYSGAWTYEGIAFYVYPAEYQPAGSRAMHRFWSSVSGRHFYTIDEDEAAYVNANYSSVWTYEGIVCYVP
ncbi:MAG: hypothetical protein KBE65_22480 [Phycisphaerae bacterium]|nr:hypothetical protein [Phycisphaerae bacterium]